MATSTQVKAHRRDVRALASLADRDLHALLSQVDAADEARDALMDALPKMMGLYGSAGATLGADWYDDLRDATETRGRFRAIPAELPDRGRAEALARWAVTPMYQAEPDIATTLVKASGGMQRIITNADRESVGVSAIQDTNAGWVRVGSGACSWCAQFIDGEVHYTAGYDFNAHDFCNCMVVPEFTGAEPTPIQVADPDEVAEKSVAGAIADAAAMEREVIDVRSMDAALSREQYDALTPESTWTPEKRESILTELRATPEGKVLADTLERFQDGGSIARLRTKIDKYLAGEEIDATSKARAEALLNAIRHSPDWAPDTLYRGMTVKGKLDNVIAKYVPGESIDLNLTSFSSDRKIATKFQKLTAKGSGNETRVMVELIGEGKRTIPIQNLPKDRRLFKEKEWVSAGRYEIVEVKKSAGSVLLRIRQIGTV